MKTNKFTSQCEGNNHEFELIEKIDNDLDYVIRQEDNQDLAENLPQIEVQTLEQDVPKKIEENQTSVDEGSHRGRNAPEPKSHIADRSDFDGEVPALPDFARLPDDLGKDACPWLDKFIEFSQKWSPRSFFGFFEAIGLWILSTIAAGRICFHFGKPRFTNLYIMLAGRTTLHAKSSATSIGYQTLKECGLDFLLAPDESTPQSFISYLANGSPMPRNFNDLPNAEKDKILLRHYFKGQVGWYAEEFGSWLASMLRTDGIMADFRGLLRRFDDSPDKYTRSTIARSLEIIEKPYLSLIANLTPADLKPLAKKGTLLWGDGFLARFTFITPPMNEILTGRFPRGERSIPSEITEPLIEFHQRLGVPDFQFNFDIDDDVQSILNQMNETKRIPLLVLGITEQVRSAYYNYHDAILQITHDIKNTDLDGNYGRLSEKALRISALFTGLEGSKDIELRHWARAQEIVERWRLYTHRLYKQVTEGTISNDADKEESILGILRRHAGNEKYLKGMSATDVSRFMHGLSRIECSDYLEKLVEVGVVEAKKTHRTTRYKLDDENQ